MATTNARAVQHAVLNFNFRLAVDAFIAYLIGSNPVTVQERLVQNNYGLLLSVTVQVIDADNDAILESLIHKMIGLGFMNRPSMYTDLVDMHCWRLKTSDCNKYVYATISRIDGFRITLAQDSGV